ncbi:MAG: hypothetical protein RLZZ182_602 [Pseudomonadota bacterium]
MQILPPSFDTDLSPSLTAKVDQDRLRILFEHLPASLIGSLLLVFGLGWMMGQLISPQAAWLWMAIKLVTLALRGGHLVWGNQRPERTANPRAYLRSMRWLVAIDGLAWGMAAWYFTPTSNLDAAVVVLGSLLGLSAMASYSLAIDFRTLAAFIVPILGPSVPFCLTRPDLMGHFGAVAMGAFLLMLISQGWRVQNRVHELLRLRFVNEEIAQQREQALEDARQHSEARSRFLATVSHEMRTPLHGMLGLTRLLRHEEPRDDQLERLRLIERSGEHLLMVINDVLDFSRMEAGRMQFQSRPFDLSRVLEDVEGIFQVLARRKGLTLTLTSNWEGPMPLVGDPGRIRQVLHNLLGNAIKFTERGSIHVHAWQREPGRFDLVVRDTGPGIAEIDRLRIFEAFTQGESGLSRARGGTGLGLSIARQLCQGMGGDLVCDSIPGMGSTFTATVVCEVSPDLLVPQPEELARPADFSDSGWLTLGARVLLVEDNPVNVVVAEAMLRNLGYEVHTVADGLQAVHWLSHHSCDVVLMDCAMPVMDGFEATREIRRRELQAGASRLPVVALTAHLAAEERERCRDAGMDDFLSKPFDADDLQRVVERCLTQGALLRTL